MARRLDTDDGFEGEVLVEAVARRSARWPLCHGQLDDLDLGDSAAGSARLGEAGGEFRSRLRLHRSRTPAERLVTIGARGWEDCSVASCLLFRLRSGCGLALRAAVGQRRFYMPAGRQGSSSRAARYTVTDSSWEVFRLENVLHDRR